MELLECGHATNDKREHCEVCEQRFNELEYGVLKYKDMGPYALGAWVLIYGCIYGMGHHMDVGARVLIWIWVHGNHMDMDAWVLTWIWVHGSSYMDAFPTPRISHFLTPMGTLRWTVIL